MKFSQKILRRDSRCVTLLLLISDILHRISTPMHIREMKIFLEIFYSRICPLPNMIYFVEVSASSPIGPLA